MKTKNIPRRETVFREDSFERHFSWKLRCNNWNNLLVQGFVVGFCVPSSCGESDIKTLMNECKYHIRRNENLGYKGVVMHTLVRYWPDFLWDLENASCRTNTCMMIFVRVSPLIPRSLIYARGPKGFQKPQSCLHTTMLHAKVKALCLQGHCWLYNPMPFRAIL